MTSNDQVRANLSANIRRLLDEREWSMSELARRTGQGIMTVKKIVDGQSNPTIGVGLRIAEAFGLTLNDLVAKPTTSKPRKKPAAA